MICRQRYIILNKCFFIGNESIQILPLPYPEENEILRDKMLKSATDKSFGITSVPPEEKIDTDLDGQ